MRDSTGFAPDFAGRDGTSFNEAALSIAGAAGTGGGYGERMDPRTLADSLVDHLHRTDHMRALWAGELHHLEEWDDITPTGVAARVSELVAFSERAAQIDATDTVGRRLADTVAFTGRARATELTWREELEWVNVATGLFPVLFTLLPRFPLVTSDHGERYLEKIARLPRFVDAWIGRLGTGAAEGRTPIRHLVTGMIASLDHHLDRPLSAGPLGRQPAPVDAPDGWAGRLHPLLDGPLADALHRLRRVLAETTLPAARPDHLAGLVHLANGPGHYERLVWAHTSLPHTAEEVHRVGLEQVTRLEDEYRRIAAPLLGVTDVADVYRTLRDDPELHYLDARVLVADAERALAKAAAAMGDWFGRLPAAGCVAVAVEHGALAFYSQPGEDGAKPGTFFFNTADPAMWGTFQLEAVTYHESIPGHHLQIAIALEDETLHPLLSKFYIAAYNEGWGLYAERIADEMGLYSTELDRVGMLSADSMRACRLVVDTGIHALGWSRDRAIDYMLQHSPMTRLQVEGEIDRYIGHPGQALGYMMGRLEIDRMRADAEQRLGPAFDIKGFHDLVLGTGSVPMSTLRRETDTWIAATLDSA